MNRIACCICLKLVFLAGLVSAQSQTDAPAGSAASQISRAEFDSTMDEWRSVCNELRKLRYEFLVCKEHEAQSVREKFAAKIKEGDLIYQRVIDQACLLVVTEREMDVREFLISLRDKYFSAGNFEDTLKIGLALTENRNGYESVEDYASDLYDLAIVAKFCNEFNTSVSLLKRLRDLNLVELAPELKQFIEDEPGYTADWEAEKAKRQAEDERANLPQVTFQTSQGEIVVELFADDAPNSVANFLDLVENQVYDNTRFFSVVKNDYAMAGSTTNDGTSSLTHLIRNENGADSARMHFRGTLTLQPFGKRNGYSGSVFMFCRVAAPYLNGVYTPIGRVIKGQGVIDRLKNSVELDDEGNQVATEKFSGDLIYSAKVTRQPASELAVERVSPEEFARENTEFKPGEDRIQQNKRDEGHDHQHDH